MSPVGAASALPAELASRRWLCPAVEVLTFEAKLSHEVVISWLIVRNRYSDFLSYATMLCHLRHQDNLANILSLLQVAVRIAHLRKLERFVDKRTNPAFTNAVQEHFHPRSNFVRFVPHVAEV